MSKHIFLTGSVHAGKSTVINKVLAQLDAAAGGFRTGFGSARAEHDRWLYLWDAAEEPLCHPSNAVVHFVGAQYQSLPAQFDLLGCEILRRARKAETELILMDECGFLERDAALFQEEILRTLDGDIPVLGVVRLRSSGWTDAIRTHPNVTLFTVTPENRNELPEQIAALLREQLASKRGVE